MDTGSIKIEKLWHSGSDYGLTNAYAHDYGANDFDLDEENHLYSNSDNGATAVLLSLGCVVNGAVDADAVSDVYDDPTSHGLTASQIVTINGTKYIKLAKDDQSGWPTLTVSNLPLKRYADVSYTDRGETKTHKAPVDGWYFIEEYGYVDANGDVVTVENKTDEWTVSYGYVDGATNGSGKTENVAGTSRNLIRAKKTDPDTLTVTNGFFGHLSFNKQDGSGQPVKGATFKLVPNAAGTNNFVKNGNADLVLTSNELGVVEIPILPMGTYWLQEQSAPEGCRLVQNWYKVEIGYPSSAMYMDNEKVTVIDNPPVGALKLTKTVQVGGTAPTTSNGAKTNGEYTFTIRGLGETDTQNITRTVRITFANGRATQYQIDSTDAVTIPEAEATDNSWTVIVPDLVPGTYTVEEALPQNGMTLKSVTAGTKVEGELAFVTVVACKTNAVEPSAWATFVNNYGKADVKIVKIDENTRKGTTQKPLSGAQFTLAVGTADADGKINYSNYRYDAEHEAVGTTGDSGELTFENLPDGNYRIQETGVPAGYVLTSDPYIYFTIEDGALDWTDSDGTLITDGEEHNKVTCDLANATFTVGNEPGARLPSTGGHGTWPYPLGGTLLILCAIAMAMVKRRRQENP
ncbi:MAG: LPXTG cell wall anchor domain-containing protein [Clostridia bacterium]|nr:LPXTG cell wall anchor domain-containing protein [Clostridia bacterium]